MEGIKKSEREINDIFEDCGELRFEPIKLTDCEHTELPEDAITFEDAEDVEDVELPLLGFSASAEVIAMLREAKERHAPVMFIDNDETRAVLVKDANDLNLKITVNGVPFEEI